MTDFWGPETSSEALWGTNFQPALCQSLFRSQRLPRVSESGTEGCGEDWAQQLTESTVVPQERAPVLHGRQGIGDLRASVPRARQGLRDQPAQIYFDSESPEKTGDLVLSWHSLLQKTLVPLAQPKHSKNRSQPLRDWFEQHQDNPYPDDDEKQTLSASTGLSLKQVCNWFVNHRKRKWTPQQVARGRNKLIRRADVPAASEGRASSPSRVHQAPLAMPCWGQPALHGNPNLVWGQPAEVNSYSLLWPGPNALEAACQDRAE
jgi:hypothetical protein